MLTFDTRPVYFPIAQLASPLNNAKYEIFIALAILLSLLVTSGNFDNSL